MIHKKFEEAFNKNIALDDNVLSFASKSSSVSQKTEKIYKASLLFYYLYDYYNGHESKKKFKKVLDESSTINDGVKPFSDSMKILKLILEPNS